ncbi:MAG TPA: BON domain-containing protein [Casimicrobiaceae bacterium]|nr:BON domain-containing protein [Casimicrobiaceae bacterium]
MRYTLAAACFVIGASLAPAASFAEDKDADRSNAHAWVKDSVITTKIKSKLASENPKTLARISVDTDQNGVVLMKGTVEKQADADKAITIARNTEGVKSVKSEIKVKND